MGNRDGSFLVRNLGITISVILFSATSLAANYLSLNSERADYLNGKADSYDSFTRTHVLLSDGEARKIEARYSGFRLGLTSARSAVVEMNAKIRSAKGPELAELKEQLRSLTGAQDSLEKEVLELRESILRYALPLPAQAEMLKSAGVKCSTGDTLAVLSTRAACFNRGKKLTKSFDLQRGQVVSVIEPVLRDGQVVGVTKKNAEGKLKFETEFKPNAIVITKFDDSELKTGTCEFIGDQKNSSPDFKDGTVAGPDFREYFSKNHPYLSRSERQELEVKVRGLEKALKSAMYRRSNDGLDVATQRSLREEIDQLKPQSNQFGEPDSAFANRFGLKCPAGETLVSRDMEFACLNADQHMTRMIRFSGEFIEPLKVGGKVVSIAGYSAGRKTKLWEVEFKPGLKMTTQYTKLGQVKSRCEEFVGSTGDAAGAGEKTSGSGAVD